MMEASVKKKFQREAKAKNKAARAAKEAEERRDAEIRVVAEAQAAQEQHTTKGAVEGGGELGMRRSRTIFLFDN